ncbi:centrosome and spindle pole associated 1-like isoform X4 [Brachionus plicatilis]|uniref:Centrosome and spindle pole associated 1-like isoform X4 n=1 Tax=Brachionus plicatilis TaxID=10195 RepID=A0A3M7SZW8_BRAPC|nr:centrosome and spindle pole associated 1-like isoform X4 [Brachionus plicatilis]
MTTASVQDIDSFIRLQKEKLNREKYNDYSPNQNTYNPSLDYERQQLDNYLAKGQTEQYQIPEANFAHYQSQQPRQPEQAAQQAPPVQNRQSNSKTNQDDFFQRFGANYDAKKNKLQKELQNDYSQYIQQKALKEANQKSKNQAPVSDEFYATLPLKSFGPQKNSNNQSNAEYKTYRENFDISNRKSQESFRGKNEIEVKPYSKHGNSSENLSSIKNSPFGYDLGNKSQSQFNVNSGRQLEQPPFDPLYSDSNLRTRSANSYENVSRYPPDYYPPQPQSFVTPIDPSLTDILRRPPVGLRSALGVPHSAPRVQFNENVIYNEFPTNQYAYQEPPRNNNFVPDTHRNQPSNTNQLNRPKDTNPFAFGASGENDQKQQKAREYQEELGRQVREKQLKKQKEKEEHERLDKKLLLENAIYNPYGRGGGGAPIKDKDGNTVANLSQVRADPLQYSPRDMPPPQSVINSILNTGSNLPNSSRVNSNDFLNNSAPNTSRKTGPNEEQSFARGGHGIFGEGKSEDQKKKEDKYKAELQQQIEEKQRLKALEKERQRIEDEKEQKRIEEELKKIQAEVEEEERKKKLKEENEKNFAENAKKIAEENRKQQNKRGPNKPVNKRTDRKPSANDEPPINNTPPIIQSEFRTNSPPVPAAAKKLNGGKAPVKKNINPERTNDDLNEAKRNFTPPPPKPVANNRNKGKSSTTADYYITESRLNVSSPTVKKVNSNLPPLDDNEEREPSNLINDYENESFKTNNKKITFNKNKTEPKGRKNYANADNVIPTKPVLKKLSRPPSQVSKVSNSEVLAQLSNLKKHLQRELSEVENKVNNSNDRTSIGQLADMRENLENIRTPIGDRDGFKTYRKEIYTPPIRGNFYRENTVLLDSSRRDDDFFSNDLQREANERQRNRLNSVNFNN